MKNRYLITILIAALTLQGCSGCSKSARKQLLLNKAAAAARREQGQELAAKEPTPEATSVQDKTVVKMEKLNGVYQIPVEINSIPMYFIFDTGAGLISISETEAKFLYKQGKLTPADVVGKKSFIDAKGEISEGTVVLLKTVRVGDKVLSNVEASVVNNLRAPLLFGQSAMEKFGKVSIDYKNAEITFE